MNAQQALSVLDQMAQRAPGTRQDHLAVAQAIDVLGALVTSEDAPDGPAPSPNRATRRAAKKKPGSTLTAVPK